MNLKYLFAITISFLFFQCKEQPPSESERPYLANEIIAFGHYDIYLSDYEGQNIRNITEGILDTMFYPYLAKFSPDGSRLLYTVDLLKYGKEDILFSERDDIFIYDFMTGKSSRLTDTEYKESMPVFSPDGKTIVFLSNEGGARHLFVMNSDGSGKRLLYASQDWQWDPQFFPDGKRILFKSRNNTSGLSDLYTINPDGTNLENLTNSRENIAEPVISKDGRYIYYTFHTGFLRGGIYKFDLQTKSKVKISEDGYYSPKISNDGTKVTFLKSDGSWTYIGMMNSDGRNAIIIDKGSDSEFSHDGKRIFYTANNGIGVYDIQSGTKKILPNTDVFSFYLEVN